MGSIGSAKVLKAWNKENFKTPFPFPSNMEEANEIMRYMYRLGDYANIGRVEPSTVPKTKIDLSKLSQSQENVNTDKMERLLKLSIKEIDAIGYKNNDFPYVVHYGNTYMIQDGHHRLSAIKAKGGKKATVRLLELKKR